MQTSHVSNAFFKKKRYQWIFIRDTVETMIKPQTEGPVPIMELLDKKLSTSPMVHFYLFC